MGMRGFFKALHDIELCVQNRPPFYNHFDRPKSGSWEEQIKIVTDLPKYIKGNHLNLVSIVRKRPPKNLILVDQNGYKKGVYSEHNSKFIFQKH
jgi:hypothetical protein